MAKKNAATKDRDKENGDNGSTKAIYVQVSSEVREIIDKYKNEGKTISSIVEDAIKKYDEFRSLSPEAYAIIERYKDKYENEHQIIEEGIKSLVEKINPSDEKELWCRMRDEMQMMLIGKTTFNQMLAAAESEETSLYKPQKKNVALDVILWYTGIPINKLSLQEIIEAIEKVWIVANYFYFIDAKKEEGKDEYHILFKHHQNRRYSEYWLGYFQELFTSQDLSFECEVEGQALDESLSLTVVEK